MRARTRFRDDDGQLRPVEATGPTPKAAERNLKEKIARRGHYATGMGELSPDTTFAKLVEVWLEDIELEDRIAASTRELYERDMRTLVMPAFEHHTLREMSISKIDRFLKAQAKISYSRAKHSKVVLNLALGLALRYEAIPRNPVAGHRPAAPTALDSDGTDHHPGRGHQASRPELAAWDRGCPAPSLMANSKRSSK